MMNNNNQELIDGRIKLINIFFAVVSVVLVARLFFWQVLGNDKFVAAGQSQSVRGEEIKSNRGAILASDSQPLAMSTSAWILFAEPGKINKKKEVVAAAIAPITAPTDPTATESAKLTNSEETRILNLISSDKKWVLIREKVSDSQKQEIENLQIVGLGFNKDQSRFYPEASSSAQLLGFVGKNDSGEDQGYFGLEGFYDDSLSGKSGFIKLEKDPKGNPLPFGKFWEVLAVSGVDLLTSLDRTVQFVIDKKLAEGISKYGAISGSITVMKPSGEILGSVSFPSYDPSKYQFFDSQLFKNPVVADSFEPGSVFKILVMAGALDSGVVEPDTECDICSGSVRIGEYSIKTWDDKYYPGSKMADVIVHSDNIGMVFVSQKLGKDRLLDYLNRFGIGQVTGIDLQEEASPALREESDWGQIDVATASFGQGVAVTPIQFLRASAAIANKGILPEPTLVNKLIGDDWEQDLAKGAGKRVVSEKAAQEITQMMIEAARAGEAKWAAPKGFRIAGKTGTAQIPISGHYDPEKTVASFVGWAPADDPKFVMLVTLREPTTSPWGSETAAPLWFSIAKELFPYFGIQPSE